MKEAEAGGVFLLHCNTHITVRYSFMLRRGGVFIHVWSIKQSHEALGCLRIGRQNGRHPHDNKGRILVLAYKMYNLLPIFFPGCLIYLIIIFNS